MASDTSIETLSQGRKRVANDIPDDAWLIISDVLQTSRLSHVNRRLHHLLCHRHVSLKCTRDSFSEKLCAMLPFTEKVHTISVSLPWCSNRTLNSDAEEGLRMVGSLPFLEAFRLSVENKVLGPPMFTALSSLHVRPMLHTISLHLLHCSVTDADAAVLAQLVTAPGLGQLTLRLCFNAITSVGAKALAELRKAPHLHTLRIAMCCTDIGDEGIAELVTLGEAPALRSLCLKVEKAGVTDRGAEVAAFALSHCPKLQFLMLDLAENPITDSGAMSFLSFREAPSLRALQLVLFSTSVGGACGRSLQKMKVGSAIQQFHLDLGGSTGLSVKGPRCWYRGGQLAPWW